MNQLNLNWLKRAVKALPPLQQHPDPQLQIYWSITQLAVLVLPFSALLGGVSILLCTIAFWSKRFKYLIQQPIVWGFGLLSLLMILGSVLAYSPLDSCLGLFNFVPFFFAFIMLSHLIQTLKQLRRLVWLMVVASIPIAVVGMAQMIAGWAGLRQIFHLQILWVVVDAVIDPNGTPPGRMSSVLTYANVLANYLIIPFVLGMGLWIDRVWQGDEAGGRWEDGEGRNEIKKFGILPILWEEMGSAEFQLLTGTLLLNGSALILTNSRNGWAIAAGACLVLALVVGWRWLVGLVGAVTATVLGAAYAPVPLRDWLRQIVPAFFWARLTDELYPDRPLPTLRSTQWKFALTLVQQRPWLGWGLRSFKPLYEAETHYRLGHPHNLPLMLLSETGIPATLLFFGLIGWILGRGVMYLRSAALTQSDRLLYFSVLLTFICDAIFFLFDVTLFDARINLTGWLLLAGLWGVATREKSSDFSLNPLVKSR